MQWLSAPYGIPELFTIGIVAGLHFWRRNAILSIFTGTGLYMVLLQFNVFSFL
ncbi:AzlD domain-containing protein [Methanosarcina flavescens]|uniref:AzlD domain-containing protein n=1 Tax=Methanosarcina flavescens TaxID=1715806 RepID=UPI002220C28F|nr:AzlD domain-containing protein [Methanosarcina flavescens]